MADLTINKAFTGRVPTTTNGTSLNPTTASEEELAAFKAAQSASTPAVKATLATAPAATKIWRFFRFNTAGDVANFANLPPAQQAGELSVTDDPNGGFDGFFFF